MDNLWRMKKILRDSLNNFSTNRISWPVKLLWKRKQARNALAWHCLFKYADCKWTFAQWKYYEKY